MNTPLPKPTYYLASNGRLFKTVGDVDCTGKMLTIYTKAQLRAYGAAEYKRGIEDAAQACKGLWRVDGQFTADEFAEEVRKLGASS